MRAFTLDAFGAAPALRDDMPEPSIGDRQLLVRVHASSVNPVDVFVAAGAMKELAEHEFPVTLGRDFAGLVERVGSGVTRYRVGDEVFGFVLHADPTVRDGSWAALIAVPEDNVVAAKPRSADFAQAGAAMTRLISKTALSTASRSATLPIAVSYVWPPTASFLGLRSRESPELPWQLGSPCELREGC
jgi:NADPH:quinone reductase-like Zn-dependent oxidoreductase